MGTFAGATKTVGSWAKNGKSRRVWSPNRPATKGLERLGHWRLPFLAHEPNGQRQRESGGQGAGADHASPCPEGAETCQPGASPRGPRHHSGRALKGRHKSRPWPGLCCPFRARLGVVGPVPGRCPRRFPQLCGDLTRRGLDPTTDVPRQTPRRLDGNPGSRACSERLGQHGPCSTRAPGAPAVPHGLSTTRGTQNPVGFAEPSQKSGVSSRRAVAITAILASPRGCGQ